VEPFRESGYARVASKAKKEGLRVMANRETGTVKWFDNAKGYGFIQRPQGDDVFVHYRAIRGEGYRTLQEGQQVQFNVVQGQKGLQAEDVAPDA